ncbi:MAG: hypothetical protein AB1649_34575, partial [Chloroflexota bacterium]
CVPTETNLGIVHVCHTSDQDIAGFAHKPVSYQWQLALMPTAPLLRLSLTILDRPHNPYRFESFLNVDQEHDIGIVDRLVSQKSLYLAFYGQDLNHRFTKIIDHDEEQRQGLRRLAERAIDHWAKLPDHQRNFDRAKIEFQQRFPL